MKRLPAPERGNRVTYDRAVPGFGLRVTAAGARAFVLRYRRRSDGRQRVFTIGGFGTVNQVILVCLSERIIANCYSDQVLSVQSVVRFGITQPAPR